ALGGGQRATRFGEHLGEQVAEVVELELLLERLGEVGAHVRGAPRSNGATRLLEQGLGNADRDLRLRHTKHPTADANEAKTPDVGRPIAADAFNRAGRG